MSTPVLCAVLGAREPAVVQALAASPQLVVARRCGDLAELLSTAAAGLGRCAVVSIDLPGLDREAVRVLRESGVRVVLVGAPPGPWQPRAAELGAHAVVDDGDPDEVREVVERVLTAAMDSGSDARPDGYPEITTPGVHRLVGLGAAHTRHPDDGDLSVPTAPGADSPRGALVAVWGPTGAPGRTSVALALADELARALAPGALLVDADTYGGTMAAVLGLLDEAPGLAAACRAAAAGRLDAAGLADLAPGLAGRLRVLTGPARADRWPEVGGSALDLVWAAARELAPVTVVDCGFCLEQDEVLSYDTRAPRRNGATLSALDEADLVVVVGSADPIGLQRLVRGLQDLTDAGVPSSRRQVVLNRVRVSAAGPRATDAVRDALRRYADVTDAVLVLDDRPAFDAALLAGRTLAEQVPGSPARRGHRELADRVAARVLAAAVPAGAH